MNKMELGFPQEDMVLTPKDKHSVAYTCVLGKFRFFVYEAQLLNYVEYIIERKPYGPAIRNMKDLHSQFHETCLKIRQAKSPFEIHAVIYDWATEGGYSETEEGATPAGTTERDSALPDTKSVSAVDYWQQTVVVPFVSSVETDTKS